LAAFEEPMPDLGKKYACYNCGTKFYNLGKPEAICPKCGANQKNAKSDEAPAPAPRPPRRQAMIETIPDENAPEFGEEAPAAADEDVVKTDEEEEQEEGERGEKEREDEEEY
jgi:uncharacterized protein (TIGR02300 family)